MYSVAAVVVVTKEFVAAIVGCANTCTWFVAAVPAPAVLESVYMLDTVLIPTPVVVQLGVVIAPVTMTLALCFVAVAIILPPVMLAVVAKADTTFELKLNPAAFKLPPVMLPDAEIVVAPVTLPTCVPMMLPPDTLAVDAMLPVAVINPPVLMLPPVTLPVAVTNPPVLKLAPVMLPEPVTVPLALTDAALTAADVIILPPVTLPVAVINPPVLMLPPTILPVAVADPPVSKLPPVTLPATLNALAPVLAMATRVAVLKVARPAAVVAEAGPMSIVVVDPAAPFSPI
jgi:hypothetical protein